jgi:GTPase SAR1 family protein
MPGGETRPQEAPEVAVRVHDLSKPMKKKLLLVGDASSGKKTIVSVLFPKHSRGKQSGEWLPWVLPD